MSNMETIGRLRELAGLPPAPLRNPKKPITVEDDFDDIDVPGDVDGIGADPVSPVDNGPLPDDIAGDDSMDDIDDVPAGTLDAPPAPDAGVPGDVPPTPMTGANTPGMDPNSPAMSAIQDAINSISGSLPDLKVSEYKQVVNQLTSLLNNARDTGRNFLGERAGHKKKVTEAVARSMDGDVIRVGMRVVFKSGIEQYGKVVGIRGDRLIVAVYDPNTGDVQNVGVNANRCVIDN